MAKNSSKAKKSSRRNRNGQFSELEIVREPKREKSARLRADEAWSRQEAKPLVCRGRAQEEFLTLLNSKDVVLGIGPAGTGKTYVSMKYAAQVLDSRQKERIIVVRPCVEAGGGLGFLAGKLNEKTGPYENPFMEVLEEHYGKSHLDNLINGQYPRILFVAPEFIRGRTFKDAIVILDEAQNLDCDQTETFLTRFGDGAQYILQGDLNQIDIKDKRTGKRLRSGLLDAMEILQGMEEVGIKTFTEEDIVRSGLCRKIALRYRDRRVAEQAAESAVTQQTHP